MNRKSRTFSCEVKLEAVRLCEDTDQSVTKIVRQLGTHPNNLYKWRTQFAADGEESFSGHGHVRTSDEEPQRLWRENMRLREERDILRKALVFFSKESQ